MPKGYVTFTEDIRDEAQINAYAQQAIPTILQAGGRVLVADDAPELIEGSWHGQRTVGAHPDRGRLACRGTSKWQDARIPGGTWRRVQQQR